MNCPLQTLLSRITLAALLWCTVSANAAAQGQPYPSRPVRVLVPNAAGGATDILARTVSAKMSEALNQNFVIDNRPGAGGNIASELTRSSPPDGYTIMCVTAGTHAINATLYRNLSFNPVRDFTPIGLASSSPNLLVVSPQLPVQSVKDLIALAKAKPGELNFASSGVGTTVHLSGELFNVMAGVSTVHIPFKGSGEAMTNVIGSRVQFLFASLSSSIQVVKSGKLRGLAVTSAKRHPAIPDVPAVNETLPGFEAVAWYGFVGPAGMPGPIVAKLNRTLNTVLQDPDSQKRLAAVGVDPLTSTPEEFSAYIKTEIPKWARVVKASGATAD